MVVSGNNDLDQCLPIPVCLDLRNGIYGFRKKLSRFIDKVFAISTGKFMHIDKKIKGISDSLF